MLSVEWSAVARKREVSWASVMLAVSRMESQSSWLYILHQTHPKDDGCLVSGTSLAVHKQVQHSSIILYALHIILQREYVDPVSSTLSALPWSTISRKTSPTPLPPSITVSSFETSGSRIRTFQTRDWAFSSDT